MNDIAFMITSVVFGLLPESIFLTLFFVFAKGLKDKRAKLFCLIFAANLVLSAVFAFSVWYHASFIVLKWLILRALFGSHIKDVFLISLSWITLFVLSVFCYFLIPDYWVAAAINRILIITFVFAFKDHLQRLYIAYKNAWNVNENPKIKSITLRNISCVSLNALLVLLNMAMAYYFVILYSINKI